MSKLGLIAVLAPFVLMAVASLECWQLRSQRNTCEQSPAMAEAVQQVTTVIFAWLATPPR